MGFVGNNLQISDDCKSYSVKKKIVTVRLNALEKVRLGTKLYLSLEAMLDAASVHFEPTNGKKKKKKKKRRNQQGL